jgi:Ser/Thr protein kinase RdoA (MazF antagonist)
LMKLSTMKKVVDTVDGEWRSPLAEDILERWGYDEGTVYYFRSSANFIFVFKKEGRRYFLRFNDSCERNLETIEAEIDILNYLRNKTLRIALPVKSLNDRYVEVVDTRIGTFYAVVFEGLEGIQYEFEELDEQYFSNWGSTLGQLHHTLKDIPEHYRLNRSSWKDHLTFVGKTVPQQEISTKKELQQVIKWAEDLAVTQETFGLIHYDFELDNLSWKDDMSLLQDFPWFMRMHNLVTYAKLLRSVDIPESHDHPEWLKGLREKLMDYIENYRVSFEKLGDKYKLREKIIKDVRCKR